MADKSQAKDAPDLKPSDAEAPGPITPEHESGSWEQTARENEAREALLKAQQGETKSSSGSSSSSSSSTNKSST